MCNVLGITSGWGKGQGLELIQLAGCACITLYQMPSPLLCWFKVWTPCFSTSCLHGLLPSGVLPLSVSKSCPSLQDCWRFSVPPGVVHTCCDAVAVMY